MLIILFGLSGTGKTYLGRLFAKECNYHYWDADEALTFQMKEFIKEKKVFTQVMRDAFVEKIKQKITELLSQYPNVIISQALYKEKNREDILKQFPQAIFILIESNPELLKKRLNERDSNIDETYANRMSNEFEPPCIPCFTIKNYSDAENMLEQFREILKSHI